MRVGRSASRLAPLAHDSSSTGNKTRSIVMERSRCKSYADDFSSSDQPPAETDHASGSPGRLPQRASDGAPGPDRKISVRPVVQSRILALRVSSQLTDELLDGFDPQAVQVEIEPQVEESAADGGVIGQDRARSGCVVMGEGRQDLRLLELEMAQELALARCPLGAQLLEISSPRAREQALEAAIQVAMMTNQRVGSDLLTRLRVASCVFHTHSESQGRANPARQHEGALIAG